MSDAIPQIIEPCPGCGQPIDVTDQAPFSEVTCPTCGVPMRARVNFNDFTLLQLLGEGGMGAVFRATDNVLHREVALKILKREKDGEEVNNAKLADEARITATINHPNVVRVYSFGEDHGQFYLAMELVNHGSLDELMETNGALPEARVLEIGIQIASGLDAAAQAGLIHRDIKPGNILFAHERLAKIVDFGLAQAMSQGSEAEGEIWGTPFYVAPEKLEGVPEDFRSDIYSLGGTLYHALAGQPPFDAETATDVAMMHLKSTGVDLQSVAPGVTDATAYVINKMMCKDPADRFASYADLIGQLEFARQQVKERDGGGKRKPRAASQYPIGLILVALALFAGGGYGFHVLKERRAAEAAAAGMVDVGAVKTLLREGREAVLERRFDDAAAKFETAGQAARKSPPLHAEALAQLGLAQLLLGQVEASQKTFAGIDDLYSLDVREQGRARSLAGLARVMATHEPVAETVMVAPSASGYDAFAMLAYGLKNWTAGDVVGAGRFLRALERSDSAGDEAWVDEWKPFVKPHLADLERYEALASATDRGEPWRQQVETFRRAVRSGSSMTSKADALLIEGR